MNFTYIFESAFLNGAKPLAAVGSALLLLVSSHAQAQCSEQRPQIGLLEVAAGGTITILREGLEHEGKNATVLCVSDELLTGKYPGWARLHDGQTLHIPANSRLVLPGRDQGVLDWVLSWFRDSRVPQLMGSMTGQQPGFRLASLSSGSALVDPSSRNLLIPVNPTQEEYHVSLYRSTSSTPVQTVTVSQFAGWVVFGPIKRRSGKYILQIEETGERAGFTFQHNPVSRLVANAGLQGAAAAMAHACMDPERNFLDAIQRLGEVEGGDQYLETLLLWQRPGPTITCATPRN